jgi:hypothetical protein
VTPKKSSPEENNRSVTPVDEYLIDGGEDLNEETTISNTILSKQLLQYNSQIIHTTHTKGSVS